MVHRLRSLVFFLMLEHTTIGNFVSRGHVVDDEAAIEMVNSCCQMRAGTGCAS
jgi:hypothetical protein